MNENSVWMKKYRLAKIYYEHYGNLNVPIRFKTKDGFTYDEDGVSLGRFIGWLRTMYSENKITEEKISLMRQIGMDFEQSRHKIDWNYNYNLACNYYKHYGNLNVSLKFKTKDGITYDEDGFTLGYWIVQQRDKYSKGLLDEQYIELLSKIGMNFQKKKYDYDGILHYELAKKYYEHHGNLEVPLRFKTKNGYEYDEDGYNLGAWIQNQRVFYDEDRLPLDRYDALLAIGMRFERYKYKKKWDFKYSLAKIYYEKNGNLNFSKDFRTKDGINYDDEGYNLYDWLLSQRNRKQNNNLSEERIKLLEEIGYDFTPRDYEKDWNVAFKLAEKYYKHHGNLEVSRSFVTKNGYKYNKNGFKLGKWIATQRCSYVNQKLSEDRVMMLDLIGMVWNMRSKMDEIIEWCNKNNINYEINSDILKHISLQELIAKTMFLLSIDENIVSEGGLLHSIFTMSNKNIQVVYGVSLEEIIKKYYVNTVYKKRKKD